MDFISINSHFPNSYMQIEKYLSITLKNIIENKREIIFLCIGTDRSAGDCLGPLIGYKLQTVRKKGFYIYGSLENPIYSVNIGITLKKICDSFKNPFIVTIGASLGSAKNINKIFLGNNPLFPNYVLTKNLISIGHISIIGIVNVLNDSKFITLQNTRLNTVMTIADCISDGIISFINKDLKEDLFPKKM